MLLKFIGLSYDFDFFKTEVEMASIQERKTKDGETHYRVQIRIKGHQTVRATFERKTDAKRWAQKIEADIRDGRYFKTAESKKHTLKEAIARYEKDILPTKLQSKQEGQLKWWKDELGHLVLADISPAVIAEYRDKLSQNETRHGKKRAPTTILRYLAALSHVLTIATNEWGWLDESPMRKVTKPKQGLLRIRFLSDEERIRLLQACKESSNAYIYPVVVLALSTGMRKSEIMKLTHDDVDLFSGRILLQKTKNGERRLLPLTGHALSILKEHAALKKQNISFLFPAENEKEPMDLRFPWEQALKRAQILNFRFHDLRHSAASYLVMNGATLVEIAEILGHKTLAMVKRYAHLSEAHTLGVVSRMNDKIFGT